MTPGELSPGMRVRMTPAGASNPELRRQVEAAGGIVTVRDVSADRATPRCVLIDTGVPAHHHYDSRWWANPARLDPVAAP